MGRLGFTEDGSWTMPDLRVDFTITRFEGGFEGLTNNLINTLLNLGAPTYLEAAWPTLEPTVIEMIYGVCVDSLLSTVCVCLFVCRYTFAVRIAFLVTLEIIFRYRENVKKRRENRVRSGSGSK